MENPTASVGAIRKGGVDSDMDFLREVLRVMVMEPSRQRYLL